MMLRKKQILFQGTICAVRRMRLVVRTGGVSLGVIMTGAQDA